MHLLDFMNFFRGANSLDSFLKVYKTEETKIFPPRVVRQSRKVERQTTTSIRSFFRKLRNIDPLKKAYNDFENFTTNGFFTEQSVCWLQLKKIPPPGNENNAFLPSICVSGRMKSFKDFLMWCNNKNVVSTLEAMQKTTEIYHQSRLIC